MRIKSQDMPHQEKEISQGLATLEKYMAQSVSLGDAQGSLMGLLHKAQTIFGYIPRQAMECISEKLNVPTAHIYGMATFYNHFSLKPKGKYQIHTCKGTACYVGGGARLMAKLQDALGIKEGGMTPDGMFSLHITRCLGCCGLSPVMQINDDIYVRMVPEKIPAILKRYRKMGMKKKAKMRLRHG